MTIKNSDFKASLKKFRRDLEQKVNERMLRLSKDLNEDLANAFVESSRTILKNNSSPKDSQSANMIQIISDSITYEENERTLYNSNQNKEFKTTGYVVRVPIDKNGLVMFLEYGTGLEGKNNRHEEADKIGWKYATNDNTIKQIRYVFSGVEKIRNIKWYTSINSKKGFVFKKKSNSYIDSKDIIFQNEHKPYEVITPTKPNKNGIIAKPYIRKKPNADKQLFGDYVISSGIKPVRFIYTAKQNIIQMINESKTLGELNNKLNKIK